MCTESNHRRLSGLTFGVLAALAIGAAPNAMSDDTCVWGWEALGEGVTGNVVYIRAMTVFDDGSGPAIYVGGRFEHAGNEAVANIAKWDGTGWAAVGAGTDAYVRALETIDLGDGPALYAGGAFTKMDGKNAYLLARFDGKEWTAVGDGLQRSQDHYLGVSAIAGYRGELLVGGDFEKPRKGKGRKLAAWNGTTWRELFSEIGSDRGFDPWVSAIYVSAEGENPSIYIGGFFSSINNQKTYRHLARWDGQAWSPISNDLNDRIFIPNITRFAEFDAGDGSRLFVVGNHDPENLWFVGDDELTSMGRSGSSDGGYTLGGDLLVWDDGGGNALYACGAFDRFRPEGDSEWLPLKSLGRWNGESWSSVGDGLTRPSRRNTAGNAMVVFNDGRGEALYVGGEMSAAGGVSVNNIARWGCLTAGDCNCDRTVDFNDIDAFVLALTGIDEYRAEFPSCDPKHADVNASGAIDMDDIDPFVRLLTGQ